MELITLIFSSMIAAIIFASGMALGIILAAWYFLCEHGKSKRLKALESAAKDFVGKVDSGKARSTDSYNKFKFALGIK